MGGRIRDGINGLASRAKGSRFEVDSRVGSVYLLGVVCRRVMMRVRGATTVGVPRSMLFRGEAVRIRGRRNLRLGVGVTLDSGSFIDALSSDGVVLGDRTTLGRGSRIECTGSLKEIGRGFAAGNNVGLGTDCFYGAAGGIEIGDNTIIGNFVSFHSENHVSIDLNRPIRLQGVERLGISVGADCWIGAKVTVLDGARVGRGCIVAAGSVVTAGSYPDYGIYGGVPARLLSGRASMGGDPEG